MKKALVIGFLSVALIGVLGVFYYSTLYKTTNDALVKADIVSLRAQVAGSLTELNVENNAPIKKGEIVAQIDEKPYKKALEEAQIKLDNLKTKLDTVESDVNQKNKILDKTKDDIEALRAQVDNAFDDYIRYKNAYKDGSVTRHDLDNAIKNLDIARESFKKAQAELEENNKNLKTIISKKSSQDLELKKLISALEEAKLNLSYTTIVSPVDGLVVNKEVENGAKVSLNQHILSIVPYESYVIAKFDPSETKIKSGQKARIKVNDNKLKGRVDTVEKIGNSLIVKIRITSDLSKRYIMPDMKAFVKIKVR